MHPEAARHLSDEETVPYCFDLGDEEDDSEEDDARSLDRPSARHKGNRVTTERRQVSLSGRSAPRSIIGNCSYAPDRLMQPLEERRDHRHRSRSSRSKEVPPSQSTGEATLAAQVATTVTETI
jgi:hypothetical protein